MKNLLAGLLLLVFVSSANAAIIDNGIYTTDSTSGLDWLDLTETTNKSYNYVSTQFGIAGEFEGYRYATGLELNGMIENYTGIDLTGIIATSWSNDANIGGLVNLLGDNSTTTGGGGWFYSRGMTADTYNSGSETRQVFAVLIDYVDLLRNDYTSSGTGINFRDEMSSNMGSFLIRESVPETSSFYLFTISLLGLFGAARRKV